MTNRQRLPRLPLVLLALVVIFLATPRSTPAQGPNYTVFVPVVAYAQGKHSIFGVETGNLNQQTGFDLLRAAGAVWVRRNPLQWKLVEPVEGRGYDWSKLASIESDFIRASETGMKYVIVIHRSPAWAVAPYSADCAPINPAKYDAYTRFVVALVKRYSVPPYNVHYWEIGNEPDYPILGHDWAFGCWGKPDDPYYNGRAYGELFVKAAKAMKAANPEINILNGGLMVTQPYTPGSSDTHGRFFEGMLEAGAGPYIDIVSFHTYVRWKAPGLPALGPRTDWRVNYLRGLMKRYGVPDRPLLRTEGALLCYEVTPECRWAQADLVGRMYARAMRDNLLGMIWYRYESDSFHNTALIEPRDVFVPRPAYFAYRTAVQLLSYASYSGPIAALPSSAEGYMFRRNGETTYIFWRDNDTPATLKLPIRNSQTSRCILRDGGEVPCGITNGVLSIAVETSPTYVVVKPGT